MNLRLKPILLTTLFISATVFADVPVSTATPGDTNVPMPAATAKQVAAAKPFMTNGEKIDHLEKQMKNLVDMDLPSRIAALQQQVQELNGELQVQQHDLKLLQKQQTEFYKDLNARVTQVENLQNNSNDNSTTASTSPATAKPAVPAVANGVASVESMQLSESASYSKAFSLLSKQQYSKAVTAFQNYISNYPNGSYVSNAHYWLGEIYAVQNNDDAAVKEFNTVVKQYPDSNKVADSELKLATIELKQGDSDKAKARLEKIKKGYPGSAAAQLATMQLKQLALQADAIQ